MLHVGIISKDIYFQIFHTHNRIIILMSMWKYIVLHSYYFGRFHISMNHIITLDEHLANQIAAGEVVERPISVVKELVENSLDAGATQIYVELQEGGISSIEVKDNGSGIPKDQLELAVQKYSTSKITSLEDLHNVMTFGFRGEALASIASVSEFSIASKTVDALSGYELTLESGKKQSFQETSFSEGTRVVVENLFYNTPARLNYLKRPRTEYNHVYDFLQKVALAHPEVGIKFVSDGTEICNFRSGETQKERIYGIYGTEVAENLLEVAFEYNGITLEGYITDPKVFYTNKNRQALFVNSRPIGSGLIYKALMDGYNRFIPHKTFPAYVLNVQIDPTQIDVNVHPRKLEIRFANEQSIFRLFYHWVKDVLEKVSLASWGSTHSDDNEVVLQRWIAMPPSVDSSQWQQEYYTGSGTKFKSYSPYKNTASNPNQSQIQDAMAFSQEVVADSASFEKSLDLHDTPLGKIVGQIHNSYIVLETPEGVKILDQHALAERVIYEKISKSSYTPNTQWLLLAETLTITPKEKGILEENTQVFLDMWFEIEILSGNNVMISGIPDFIKKESIENIFLGILQDISGQSMWKSTTLEEVRNKIFAYTACRSAIKFGDKLSLFEMNQLLHDAALDYSATCPHGRPVVWEMGLDQLQKKYER